MQQRSTTFLRAILALVCLTNAYFGYLFFVQPHKLRAVYGYGSIDLIHQHLAMIIGALLIVFAIGSGDSVLHDKPFRIKCVKKFLLTQKMVRLLKRKQYSRTDLVELQDTLKKNREAMLKFWSPYVDKGAHVGKEKGDPKVFCIIYLSPLSPF